MAPHGENGVTVNVLRLLCLLLPGTCLFIFFLPTMVLGQVPPWGAVNQRNLVHTSNGPWVIDADRLSYDHQNRVYVGEGNVHVHSGDRSLRAQWASVNLESQTVELRGNVRLEYGRDWLEGDHVHWDLNEETGTVDEGLLFFSANGFYVQGRSIAKVGPNQFTLVDGFVTSCPPGRPDWKLRYGRMEVNVDGVAWVRDTSFWARRVPLIYLPVLAFPVQTQRKPGFLAPWAGFSRLHGLEGEIPYYWAMREDMDVTLHGRYMVERGFMGTVEYRVHSEKWGQGAWLFTHLYDQADREHLSSRGYPFETRSRFWLRSRHSVSLTDDLRARIDLDVVSDRNYLKEFERGAASFDYSDRTFRDFLGRGILNDKNLPARESSLYVDRRFQDSLLGLDVRYWDQLDPALDEFTLQRLPEVSFHTIPSWFMDSPFYYTLHSSLVHHWRSEGDRGNRLDVYPRLYFPLHWKSYVDVEPSLGGRVTGYHVDWEGSTLDAWQSRFQGDVRVEVSSRLNRVYPLEMGDYVAFQHAFRPEVQYVYSGEGINQDRVPQFDRLDQNQFQHSLSYGFTNFLTSKKVSLDPEGKPVTSFHEFARLRLFQFFNIDPLPEDIRFVPKTGRGFTAVGLRTDFMPHKYVTLTYDSLLYSTDREDLSHELYLTLNSGKGHVVRFNYQYREDRPVDEFIAETDLRITPQIYLSTYHNYSLEQNEMFKQGYGVRYLRDCWGVTLRYEKERDDQRIAFSVNLLGLGALGTTFAYGGDSPVGLP